MRYSSIGSLLVAGGLVLLAAMPARAADFYLVGWDQDDGGKGAIEDADVIIILDPASIARGEGGHVFVDVVQVEPFDLWDDDKWDVDCPRGRLRRVKSEAHTFDSDGDTVIGSRNEPEEWRDISAGTNGAFVRDTACHWPDTKPATRIFSAPDLLSVVRQISEEFFF